MLEDRYYMRRSPFDSRLSATMILLLANIAAFLVECVLYHYPPQFPHPDYLALSWSGLKAGYLWQLLTFQFLHAGILHLLFNCLVIYFFGRELEIALGVRRFVTLYLASGVVGGLFQASAGAFAEHFPQSDWWARFAAPTVGASAGGFGLIAAYAVLYPERPLTLLLFLIIPVSMRAKFLLLFSAAIAVFGIAFPVSNMADAAHLGGMLTGVVFIRYAIHWDWKWPRLRRNHAPIPRRLVKVSARPSGGWGRAKGEEELPADEFLSREVDPILDKISAHGIQSLTERERRVLEAARQRMAKR